MRHLLHLLPVLVLLFGGTAFGQTAAPAAPRAATPAATPAAAPAPSELERLLSTLRNDAARADLLRNLETLLAAQRSAAPPAASGTAPATPAPAAPAPAAAPAPDAAPPAAAPAADLLAPNTLGAQLLTGASQRLQSFSESLVAAAEAATDLPSLARWASDFARDPVTQTRVIDAAWKLALLFAAGLLAEWLTRRGLRRWSDRLDALAPENGDAWTWMRRVPLVLARLILDLVPLAAFAVISYGMISAVRPLPTTELVLLLANNAYLALRAIMALSRMLFSPASSHLRLVPCQDETAAYVTVWVRRIVAVAIAGFAVAEAGLQFGLPWAAYDGVLRLSALIVSLLLIIVILQNRAAMADLLRAPELKPGDQPDRMRRLLRMLRDRLAEVWHVLAILWLIALWGVWALEVRDGFERLLRVSLVTLAIFGIAKLVDELARRAITRGFSIGPDLARRYPGLEARANRYVPVLKGILSALIMIVTLLFLLEAWGVSAFAWFRRGQLGARLLASLVSIGLTVAVAVTVWEVANAAIQRYLVRLSRDAQAARSARVRTLMPMLRTLLSGTILVFVALNVLTEIGINVAPLIAGAGVIGLAIGFGSQTLVRDVITGIFLLFEDAVAVGDVVSVGGLSGVVEQLSIRSIKLRAQDGSIHIIPFSAVTTVTNMTRDFSFAVLDVSVGYGEDTDRVVEVMKEVAADIRADPKFAPIVRDELEVLGVERLADSGVLIRARIKGEPMARWSIGREFNRRIKQRFDQLGIEIPYPHQKLVIDRQQARHPAEDFPEGQEGAKAKA
ncbi:mechanosensitive ion channel domain-containing protein [Falsiroseomonas tokyonensis]|uniref:Mechanosensitive ion channel domain-containing protein n=1 Tax=Falsiroseomonas tokyonensis TaxID=430521 RepID=A0ABV7BY52_9PROT|nr:mechanosensitive ion channel domain-containing protein [Falsiroseomonas tokyonensis]MBU8540498.1 mechanosensitive ion channel [Falsiroseomonas tokyonensis]